MISKNPNEFSKYAVAHIDSTKYINYYITINFNPRFIALDLNGLVKTGLHEYCHIIYRQKEDFSNDELRELFPDIDFNTFFQSIDSVIEKLVPEFMKFIPPEKKEISQNSIFIEDVFVECVSEYLIGSQTDFLIKNQDHFNTIINTHIKIMKKIRHHLGEL